MSDKNQGAGPVEITLPDGTKQNYDGAVTGATIAASIGPGLAKAAMAIRVNGDLIDLSAPITANADVSIITERDEEEALDLLRHDCAHVMAQAVQELFPGTQVTIGPNIDNGFFYDFARDEPFSSEDFEAIEKRMHEIVAEDVEIRREVWDRDEAISHFEGIGEKYKAEIIRDLPGDDDISVYHQGSWKDLCRGPHLPSTGKVGKAFKLMKVAGAYWRGDSNNEMLQRIYGTAWADKKQLKEYLHMVEEAEKRDHRRLGREMELFHLQEEAQGAVFWHPKGWTMYRILQDYIRGKLEDADYAEVNTPQLVDRSLWEASGHWEKFRENMFI
ncbi:MAG: TGS domain-containing protein, partial [Sphingomonadales bacterium]|nr:TGS domain-containing protein [Sphingomonadales bacterium]